MKSPAPIAIVGIGGVFPGASDLAAFWDNILRARDLAREPPPDRWLLALADVYDPHGPQPDHVYSKRACFVDNFTPDLRGLAIDPGLCAGLDPMFHLLLHAGSQCWRDSITAGIDRDRVGVIIGNIALPTDAASALADEWLLPVIEEQIVGHRPTVSPVDKLNRYVAGLPAGILARALGLGGGSYTLDAACASSLYAVKFAADELQAGRADAMLAGGLSRPDSLYTQMGFSSLHALSASGRCAPFDYKADGLVVGEGCGMVMLKRLDDAIKAGDKIYAVIKSAGLSNDIGGNLMSPDTEGQLRAMRAAYTQAGWQPWDVDLIECHGTGTPVGDVVEFNSLRALWDGCDGAQGCVIGSVKSNIGHLLTAAGAAGLIKVLLALRHETLPPTANFENAHPRIDLARSPFTVLSAPRAWPRRAERTPRRAAISAFGFGGINAHLLLEEWRGAASELRSHPRVSPVQSTENIAIIGMDAAFGPWSSLAEFERRVFGGDADARPRPLDRWWGVANTANIRGFSIDQVAIPVGRFRIPPQELSDMLPQQLLMLQVAANAIADAGIAVAERMVDAGVYIGIGLDLNTTNFHLRWSLLDKAREWNRSLALDLTDAQIAEWAGELRDHCHPPLTANRTMGALGGIVASRIARAFNTGGPGFTLSSEETSGLRAVEAAVRTLQRRDINLAIAGAVDLAGDVRAVLGQAEHRPYSATGAARPLAVDAEGAIAGAGAAALILKRLADARRDGDRIYAVIKGLGNAGAGATGAVVPAADAYRRAAERAVQDAGIVLDTVSHIETHGSGCPAEDRMEAAALAELLRDRRDAVPCAIGSVQADIGHAGAASGLAAMVRAALSLYHRVIPPLRHTTPLTPALTAVTDALFAPRRRLYWLRNKAAGARHALVNGFSVDGNCVSVVLAESDATAVPITHGLTDETRPWLFSIAGDSPAELLRALEQLTAAGRTATPDGLPQLARDWRHHDGQRAAQLAISLIAATPDQLMRSLASAGTAVARDSAIADGAVFYVPRPSGPDAKIAFVFPGSGNHFHGMGREAGACWPHVLHRLDAENDRLADQFAAMKFWTRADPSAHTVRDVILGQVWLGTLMSDIVAGFGIRPDAVIGYSLGETAGLFATRAWRDRDLMLRRIQSSTLFTEDLAGPCRAARQQWGLGREAAVEWLAGVVDRPAAAALQLLRDRQRAYLLIINTDGECVIGGERAAVLELARDLNARLHPIAGVSTVHCEVVEPVKHAYRALHRFETTPPAGVKFYSGHYGRDYPVTRDSAADSITGQALHYFDYPRIINGAYADGVRIFIEMGPGASCTRMIDQILGDRTHLARAVCVKGQSEALLMLRLLAELNAHRVPLDLHSLYPVPRTAGRKQPEPPARSVSVPVGKANSDRLQDWPRLARRARQGKVTGAGGVLPLHAQQARDAWLAQIIAQTARTEAARSEAQAVFLRVANGIQATLTQALALQTEWLRAPPAARFQPVVIGVAAGTTTTPPTGPALFNRERLLEFAVGSIAGVLGPEFADVDTHPTRVRLPDEPLMLVDRILALGGKPGSLRSGNVVTEHDILPDAWYLDGGRIPTCIAVEAGQADLFLSAYLGIDQQTRGLAMYRLLDAEVTFHAPLPRPEQTIRYDIHIDHFFRQGHTWLFRFHFDGTVNGRLLITMCNGCAGFFTRTELEAGQGIVLTSLEKRRLPGKRPADWIQPVPMHKETYTDAQIDALRSGRPADCFGAAFADLPLTKPAGLPGGRMTLVQRVLELDPDGGRYGIGLITGEADIHPDDWFLTCHFVDDRVMPGTLMYECCLHTLRIYLLRMGWIGEADAVVYEPLPGITSKLKCRGQVIESTRQVRHAISLKEYGYLADGTPYVIADALMYADGRAIVQMTDMSLRLSGLNRNKIQELWRRRPMKKVLFDHDSILAFAIGKPSVAFGDRYRVFDDKRVIARLPGPPYQFLDRIVAIEHCAPWELKAGGRIEAEYDVPADAWYFDANRQPRMPFAVLLEAALQPCGWLAAYLGSALTSEQDLSFRNLGGACTQYRPVTAATGTLSSTVHITDVSRSGGMIIQHFDFSLRGKSGTIYTGSTYFGFFTRAALAHQIGLRYERWYEPAAAEIRRSVQFDYPDQPPYPKSMLRMIDRITCFDPQGGPHGLGFIQGSAAVDPELWFFKAHFFQDPVWPGSLGLESFIQLLKVAAVHYWGAEPAAVFESPALGQRHEWQYRGQILPTDNAVTVQAVITELNPHDKLLRADGLLGVDGRIIYRMRGFTLRIT